MSTFPPPEFLSKREREGMAEELGLPPDYFEAELDMDRKVTVRGKIMTMREWAAEWKAGKAKCR